MEGAIVGSIPHLRAFAISLCRNRDRADELVQETLTRAIAHIGSFEEGSNLGAWLFTILRNNFYNEFRKSNRVEHDADDRHAGSMTIPPDQAGWELAEDFRAGFGKLSNAHRQALFLVGASGLSYDEASAVAGCPVGTMKTRVNRARRSLAAYMSEESACGRS
jgi:RNA polymerase sigma-70 factor (ECF subfamily)